MDRLRGFIEWLDKIESSLYIEWMPALLVYILHYADPGLQN